MVSGLASGLGKAAWWMLCGHLFLEMRLDVSRTFMADLIQRELEAFARA